ncbi:MAG TPA: universal stress protein [Steroidobacteraceae bacterium]|jgi:nucleotide-binding universal stress UspA family protein
MNILAAVDFSAVTKDVLDALGRIGASMPAKVFLVHVAPPEPDFVGYSAGPDVVRGQVAIEHRARHQQLQRLAEDLRANEVETTALLLQGATVETLIAEAGKLEAGLIVLGSHGHGAVYDLLVGSVAEGVVRRSTVPVLLVPARP